MNRKKNIQDAALNGGLVDYVEECRADVGVEATIEQFMQAFCSRCLRPECHRSSYHGLTWAHRMRRQEQGLKSPIFLPTDDPRYSEHASQEFESFAQQKVRVQNWESFQGARQPSYLVSAPDPEEPSETDTTGTGTTTEDDSGSNTVQSTPGRRVIHNNNLPWETVQAVEDSTRVQKAEPATVTPVPKPEPEPRPEPRPEPQERPARKQMTYNTPMPEGGIMLPGAPPAANAQPRTTGNAKVVANDPWAVPTSPEEAAQRKEKGRSTLKVKLGGTKKRKDT